LLTANGYTTSLGFGDDIVDMRVNGFTLQLKTPYWRGTKNRRCWPIVVWLYPRNPPLQLIPGRFDGILAKGTIAATNLVGIMQGMIIPDLVEEMD